MAEWTVQEVAARFCAASKTARRLPAGRGQGYFSLWPTIVRTPWEQMAHDDPPVRLAPPSPEDVDRMLEVMRWVQWLEVEQRHLVWMRSEHHEWEQIGRRMGCCRQTAARRWRQAIEAVTARLNG